MTTLAVGNYLTFKNPDQTVVYRFQNFHIGETSVLQQFQLQFFTVWLLWCECQQDRR